MNGIANATSASVVPSSSKPGRSSQSAMADKVVTATEAAIVQPVARLSKPRSEPHSPRALYAATNLMTVGLRPRLQPSSRIAIQLVA